MANFSLWVRSLGFSSVKSSADLFVREKISPLELEIREAYVDVYGFLFPWLDLRIGRQRIAWGTADRVNPTDNLNPDDLEDIWDFGRHLGSDALKATGYFGSVTLTGVFIPSFIKIRLKEAPSVASYVTVVVIRDDGKKVSTDIAVEVKK